MKTLRLVNTIKIPLFLLFLIIGLDFLEHFGVLPSINDLAIVISSLLEQYGLVIVGPLSFLENIILINTYFPGSIVILTAMALTAGNPVRGLLTYLNIYLFAFLAYHLNYYIGLYLGDKLQLKADKHKRKDYKVINLWLEFFITFWHPQLAAYTCFKLGEENFQYKDIRKYILVVSFFWNTFWGLAMYFVGQFANTKINFQGLSYIYIIVWLSMKIYRFYSSENTL